MCIILVVIVQRPPTLGIYLLRTGQCIHLLQLYREPLRLPFCATRLYAHRSGHTRLFPKSHIPILSFPFSPPSLVDSQVHNQLAAVQRESFTESTCRCSVRLDYLVVEIVNVWWFKHGSLLFTYIAPSEKALGKSLVNLPFVKAAPTWVECYLELQ
nr:MAG TPA: hypothetical protein [Caudoviricetes sp.]